MIICQNKDTCDVSRLKCKQKSAGRSLGIHLDVIYDVRCKSYVNYELEYVKLIAAKCLHRELCLDYFCMSK